MNSDAVLVSKKWMLFSLVSSEWKMAAIVDRSFAIKGT